MTSSINTAVENSKTGLFVLHNIVSTFPQLVNLVAYAGIAIGLFFFYQSYLNFNSMIRTSIGVKQYEHHLKKGFSFHIFGMLAWNLEWFTQILVNTLGFNVEGSEDYLNYYAGDIFQNNNGMSDILSYVMWICNMIGFISLLVNIVKANYAIVNPQPKSMSRAILGFIIALALIRIKEVLWIMAIIFRSDSLATWLGYSV